MLFIVRRLRNLISGAGCHIHRRPDQAGRVRPRFPRSECACSKFHISHLLPRPSAGLAPDLRTRSSLNFPGSASAHLLGPAGLNANQEGVPGAVLGIPAPLFGARPERRCLLRSARGVHLFPPPLLPLFRPTTDCVFFCLCLFSSFCPKRHGRKRKMREMLSG